MAQLAQQPIIETDAFRQAVASQVQQELADMRAQLLGEMAKARGSGDGTATPNSPDISLFENLVTTLVEMTNQGTGRQKPVAPEVIRARNEASRKMEDLIFATNKERRKYEEELKDTNEPAAKKAISKKIADLTPAYRLTSEVYLGEAKVSRDWVDSDHVRQPTDIDWTGAPNLAMMPLNAVAKEIHTLFQASIGHVVKDSAAQKALMGQLNVRTRPRAIIGDRYVDNPGADVASSILPELQEGLNIRHKSARGQRRLVNVLGTISQPAEISG